jgi:cadmium resistance protein CadD (predicted permease)
VSPGLISPGLIGQAAGLFAVTNIDDILILALFFAQGAGHRHTARSIAAGQYLGFAGILVAVWVAAGRFFATRPPIARALSRWGHILLPVVLIGIGLLILIEGGAFGL